jgi:hypothetical protein
MPKPTDEEIENQLADALWEVMTGERFHKFYMSKSKKSLEAHICGDDNCPTKVEIKEQLKRQFDYVMKKAKEIVHAC